MKGYKMNIRQKQKKAFDAPLKEGENEYITIGCRHTNPNICASAYLENICAFVRKDGTCLNPGRGWKKKYVELLSKGDK